RNGPRTFYIRSTSSNRWTADSDTLQIYRLLHKIFSQTQCFRPFSAKTGAFHAGFKSSTRLRSDSSFLSGFLETPLFFMWLHTNSSGFKSGAYVGKGCNSNRPPKLSTYFLTTVALWAGWPSKTRNTFPLRPFIKSRRNNTKDAAFNLPS